LFKITAESAVSAGVRRIEAITSSKALAFLNEQAEVLASLKELLKNPIDIQKSVEQLIDDHNKTKKLVEKFMQEKADALKNELRAKITEVNGVSYLAEQVDLNNVDLIKNVLFELKQEFAKSYFLLAAEIDQKPHLALMISEELVAEKSLNASNIIRELGKEIQGGGGGQAFFATAGGKNVAGIPAAIQKAKQYL
jgi:alanyl-tRNA synthetase